MLRYFFKLIIIFARIFLQQPVITQPVTAKMVIVTNNNGMRMKFINQEVFNIIFGRLIGKSIRKWHHYHMINT